jgi:hypothetical protein
MERAIRDHPLTTLHDDRLYSVGKVSSQLAEWLVRIDVESFSCACDGHFDNAVGMADEIFIALRREFLPYLSRHVAYPHVLIIHQ